MGLVKINFHVDQKLLFDACGYCGEMMLSAAQLVDNFLGCTAQTDLRNCYVAAKVLPASRSVAQAARPIPGRLSITNPAVPDSNRSDPAKANLTGNATQRHTLIYRVWSVT